jgi:outer membrane protein TolC
MSHGSSRRVAAVLGLILCFAATGAHAQTEGAAPHQSSEPRREQDQLFADLSSLVGRPGGLTANEVARRAGLVSPAERARSLEVAASQEDLKRVYQSYWPELSLAAKYTRSSEVPAGRVEEGGVTLSFPALLNEYWMQGALAVPVSSYVLTLAEQARAARHSLAAARLRGELTRRANAAEARLAFYTWVRARLGARVSAQTLEQATQVLAVARANLELGRVSAADVLRAESQAASAELALSEADELLTLAEARLRTLMHDPSSEAYVIGEDVLGVETAAVSESLGAALARAVAHRLEARLFAETAAGLRSTARARERDAYPRLVAFANVYYANPHPRVLPQRDEFVGSWDAGLGVSWSASEVARARTEARAQRLRADAVDAERAAFLDALREEVLAAQQAVRRARADARTAERGLLAAHEAYRVRRELFALGRTTSLEVTNSETELMRARLALISARIGARVARVQWLRAIGADG